MAPTKAVEFCVGAGAFLRRAPAAIRQHRIQHPIRARMRSSSTRGYSSQQHRQPHREWPSSPSRLARTAPPLAAAAVATTALHAAPHSSSSRAAAAPTSVDMCVARTVAELRAAAFLRASAFYTYPPGRSEWAERSHRRMKADAEWEELTAKVEGRDKVYEGVRVTPFIATLPDDPDCPLAAQVGVEVDNSSKLPAPGPGQLPSIVVATLDLNQGRALPAEELRGKLPHTEHGSDAGGGDPATQRAYLSNVCVAKSARRLGLAQRLIRHVEQHARDVDGVLYLYVHVAADNEPAKRLYIQLGYQQEAEERSEFARAAGRPRRLLLCKQLL